MPDPGATDHTEITVEGIDKLRQRLEGAKSEVRKLWHRRCECSCGCPISHAGRKDSCVLCLGGDHWDRIVQILDEAMERKEKI